MVGTGFMEQLAALERWGLGDGWLHAVCWSDGTRLLQVPQSW